MLPIERQNIIIDELKKNGIVQVDKLATDIKVTSMTIRRDLDKLEKKGKLKRIQGGAVTLDLQSDEDRYDIKRTKNIEVKKAIAELAFELIKEESTIYLDSGTTTYELAKKLLKKEGLTIITDDINIAALLYKSRNQVYIIGGRIEEGTGSILMNEQDNIMNMINIDYAFIATASLSEDGTLTTPSFEKAKIKQKVIEIANKSFLLVDKSKFGINFFIKITNLKVFDAIITDIVFSEKDKEKYKELLIVPVNSNLE